MLENCNDTLRHMWCFISAGFHISCAFFLDPNREDLILSHYTELYFTETPKMKSGRLEKMGVVLH